MKKKEYIENMSYSPNALSSELKNELSNIFNMKKKVEIVSEKAKYSNCYLEAIKRKIKNPFKVRIIPIVNKNTYVQSFLFNKVEFFATRLNFPKFFDNNFWW